MGVTKLGIKLFSESLKLRASFGRHLRNRRWGEPIACAFIFLAGLVFTAIQIWTWVLPHLILQQEFQLSRCMILDVKIEEKVTSSGTFYRPAVLVEHFVDDPRFNGQTYRTWAYDFQSLGPSGGFFSDRETAQKVLETFDEKRLPPNRTVPCRYRDGKPEEIVISWNVSVWGLFFLLLSILLIVLGAIGFIQSFRLRPQSLERFHARQRTFSQFAILSPAMQHADWPTLPDSRFINESPGTHLSFRLPLANQSIFPLVGLVLFCMAWNIIAGSIFFYSLFYSGENLSGQIAGTALRALFFGIGILLLAWTTHHILIAFGTGPTLLEISDHPIYPGRRYRLLVHQSGVLRFRELTIDLVCEEVARFRQGTETITNRKDVFRQTLLERQDFETTVDTPLNEEFFLNIPVGAMHSFRQENNEIIWKIAIAAQIAGWSDMRRECPIVVRPAPWSGQMQDGIGY